AVKLPRLRRPLAERHDGDERGTVAQEARVVLVARRLVDLGLAPELRLDRLDAQAVRLDAAVTAPLAHGLVDHHAHRRVREPAALAETALLRGAALVVDQRRHPGDPTEEPLGLVEPIPVPHLDGGGPPRG